MRPLLIVGTLFIAACSSDGILTPDQTGLTRQANISDNPQQPTCVLKSPLTFYVAAGRTKGNGSFGAPFGTIGEALTAGSARGACHLRVLLRGGTFPESFAVPVPRLEISTVGGRNVIAGAIVNAGRWLEMRGVEIVATGTVGLRQTGGRLKLSAVSITAAKADDKILDSGIGLWLSDGALATLDLVVFDRNDHQAIRLEGVGTEAWLTSVGVTNTGNRHPAMLGSITTADEHMGAVQVSRGAKAIVRLSTITGSKWVGLNVDNGAEALLVHSRVSDTGEGDIGTVRTPALNIVSNHGAVVEAFFLQTRNAIADLFLADDAFLTLHHAVIGGAEIGLVLLSLTPIPGYSPLVCASLDGTIFTDVTHRIQADVLPPPTDPESPVAISLCRHVANDPRPF